MDHLGFHQDADVNSTESELLPSVEAKCSANKKNMTEFLVIIDKY